MKTLPKAPSLWLIPCCVLATAGAAWPASTPAPAHAAAIQAIQQAPDPSAVVSAYANGIALDRYDAKLYEAYVARMVDLGLQEMAYHQARMLTSLQFSNGLAWGVVAYVAARRGQMPEAVSAINLAGQFAPENQFVAHTAGELVALVRPQGRQDGTLRTCQARPGQSSALLAKQIAFTGAYETACKAYQAQTKPEQQPAQSAPGQAAPPPVAPGQYAPALQIPGCAAGPDCARGSAGASSRVGERPGCAIGLRSACACARLLSGIMRVRTMTGRPRTCYDWGPGWLAPTPWCWWQPCGFWGGCGFVPFGTVCLFGGFDDFHHFHHDRDFGHGGRFEHGGDGGRTGAGGHAGNPVVWHHDPHRGNTFFGTPARPNLSMMQSAHQASQGRAALTTASTGAPWWSGARQPGSTSATSRNVQSAQASAFENRGGSARLRTSAERQNSAETSRGTAWALPSGSSFGGYRQAPFSGEAGPIACRWPRSLAITVAVHFPGVLAAVDRSGLLVSTAEAHLGVALTQAVSAVDFTAAAVPSEVDPMEVASVVAATAAVAVAIAEVK